MKIPIIKKPQVLTEVQSAVPEEIKLRAEPSGQADKLCGKISKISIYLLVFLLPLFFLPWTVSVLDFNKQLLLILLVFISLLCWLLKSLQEGKINLNWSRLI